MLDIEDLPILAQRSDWIAQAGSQFLFLSCPVREVLYEGTRGPGKTDSLLAKFAKHVGRGFGPAWRGIIFRETYKQLEDIIAKSHKMFGRIFPRAKYNSGKYIWNFPDGEALLFRHARRVEDYDNYHGHEYPFVGWEELTGWSNGDLYDKMKSVNRSSHPGMPRIYASTTNPHGKGHNWVKNLFIIPAPRGTIIRGDGRSIDERGRVAIHGDISENKILLASDPEYLQTLDAIRDPNRRKAWRFGSWDITAGGMLDDLWDPNTHVLPPFEIPYTWKIDRSYDHGSTKPFSVGWWAESDGTEVTVAGKTRVFPKGTVILINEYYGWSGEPNKGLRMLSSNIAKKIKKIEKDMGYADRIEPGPADNSINDIEDGHDISAEMATIGVTWLESNKGPGSRKQGWERIREMLGDALPDAKGRFEGEGMYVCANCPQWIRTVPVLPRDPDDEDDVDTDSEDHCGDMTRYRVLRKPRIARMTDG